MTFAKIHHFKSDVKNERYSLHVIFCKGNIINKLKQHIHIDKTVNA